MRSHTPGPWTRNRFGELTGANGKKVQIADAGVAFVSAHENPEALANSALFHSAPDLLKALEKYQQAWDDIFGCCLSNGVFNAWGRSVHCENLNEAKKLGDAAIAKATRATP